MLAASAAWAGEFTLTVNDSGAPAAVACSPAGGVYDDGSVVSVTAPGEGFVKWIGDVDAQSESNATISVTMDADKTLVPLYHRMWVLEREGDSTSGFIREVTQPEAGHTNWLLNVREISNSGKTIRIGNATNTGYRGHAYVFDGIDIIGNGKMDLSTKVVDADGNSWTIEKIVGTALGMDNAKMWKLNKVRANTMTECIFPTTLTAIDSNILDNDATMTKTLTNVVMVCPNATGYLRNWFFNGQNQLKRLTLKCPKITYMQKCIFQSTVLTDTDVGEWDLSGIERITEGQTFLNFREPEFCACQG